MTVATLPTVQPGTYRIDPTRSTVRFTATHSFGLKPVDGTMTISSGMIVVASRPEASTVAVELDAASFRTDNPRRDTDVRGKKFLDVANHPSIAFRSTGLDRGADGWQLTGRLSVRSGGGNVVLDLLDVTATPDGYRFVASARVDRHGVGVTAGRAIIARHVQLTFEIYGAAAL